ncbi:polysaccharide biosynthesis C-terminal domain-containing protein [Erysipelotrichaceae bacterium RD49]|nr:polysaccharide biosynthesis C-terminal domain-containing protein [Erysipelotrichaceae bacterium RD49]
MLSVTIGLIITSILKIGEINIDMGIIIFLYYFAYMANQYFIQLAKGLDQVKYMAIGGVIGTIVTVALCIILLVKMHYGLKGYFIACIGGQAIPAIFLYLVLKPKSLLSEPENYDKNFERKYLNYTIPLILTNIGWWINNASDRYIITWMKGVGVNGLLSIAYKIPNILNVLYGLFIQAWQISAMKEYGKDDSPTYYNAVFIWLSITLYFLGSGLIITTKYLSQLMFAKDFIIAWKFVPFLILSSIFTAIAGYISPILTSSYDAKSVAKSTIYGGIINIILNILLTLLIGSQGVTIATAISGFSIMLFRYLSLKKPRVIFDTSFERSLIMWGALVIQATAMLYSNYYIQIISILVVMLLFRRNLIVGKEKLLCYLKNIFINK